MNNIVAIHQDNTTDLLEKLDEAFTHLLNDASAGSGEASMAERTSALKACVDYLEKRGILRPLDGSGEGAFNGFRAAVADLPTNRRGRSGSRDGGTDDADAF